MVGFTLTTLIMGPSPYERLYPRPTNGVTGEEVMEPPPLLEVRLCNCSCYCSIVVTIYFVLMGAANSFTAWNRNDRDT